MFKRCVILFAAIAALVVVPAVAVAASIGDLSALGYSVSVSSELPGATPGSVCKVYSISGFGISTFANQCDPNFQSTIDSIANPAGHCNRKWQTEHPDQLAALQSITGKGWSVSGDQCADTYNVTNPNDGSTAYSGGGSGLPGFDASHGAPPAAAAPTTTTTPSGGGSTTSSTTSSSGSTTPSGGACLPLCPNPGDTRGAGGAIIPAPGPAAGTIPVVTETPLAPAQQQSVTSAVTAAATPTDPAGTPVDTSSFTIVAASPEIAESTDVVAWLNSPYVTLALADPAE